MPDAVSSLPAPRAFGQTRRPDAWWIKPLVVFLGFSTFVVYSTWAASQGEFYESGSYLSPFYSPEIFGDSPHALFGPRPGWWPGWLPLLPRLPDPLGPRRVPAHLLLLPGGVLQGLLGGSALVRRGRAPERVPG